MNKVAVVSDEWLLASSRLTAAANQFARRNDLIASIFPRVDETPAAAWFIPSKATIDVDPAKIGMSLANIDPTTITLQTRRDRRRFAVLTGVLSHEAAHAAHTHLTFPEGTTQEESYWTMLLEEPRIERRALTESNTSARSFLRTAIRLVVMNGSDDFKDESGTMLTPAVVRSMVLILGRRVATVLNEGDVAALVKTAEEKLGEAYPKIMDVITRAVHLDDNCVTEQVGLARELIALVNEATPPEEKDAAEKALEALKDSMGQSGQGNAPEGAQGAGEGSQRSAFRLPCGSLSHDDGNIDEEAVEGAPGDTATDEDDAQSPAESDKGEAETTDPIADAVSEALDAAEKGGIKDLSDETRTGATPGVNPEREQEEQSRKDSAQVARDVFARGSGAGTGARGPHRVRALPATRQDADQVRAMTTMLRRAQFRETSRVATRTATPPGRMRVREVVRRQSQVEMGAEITATPWSRVRRRVNDAPPIYLGVSIDVSGSMNAYQEPASSLAWAVAQATKHLPGRVAAVAWHSEAFPLTAPGHTDRSIPVAASHGTSEGCPESLLALEGALDLYPTTDGIKIIIVVTDGNLPNGSAVNNIVTRLRKNGVHTLWVTVPSHQPKVVPRDCAEHVELRRASEYGAKVGAALSALSLRLGQSVN